MKRSDLIVGMAVAVGDKLPERGSPFAWNCQYAIIINIGNFAKPKTYKTKTYFDPAGGGDIAIAVRKDHSGPDGEIDYYTWEPSVVKIRDIQMPWEEYVMLRKQKIAECEEKIAKEKALLEKTASQAKSLRDGFLEKLGMLVGIDQQTATIHITFEEAEKILTKLSS